MKKNCQKESKQNGQKKIVAKEICQKKILFGKTFYEKIKILLEKKFYWEKKLLQKKIIGNKFVTDSVADFVLG